MKSYFFERYTNDCLPSFWFSNVEDGKKYTNPDVRWKTEFCCECCEEAQMMGEFEHYHQNLQNDIWSGTWIPRLLDSIVKTKSDSIISRMPPRLDPVVWPLLFLLGGSQGINSYSKLSNSWFLGEYMEFSKAGMWKVEILLDPSLGSSL